MKKINKTTGYFKSFDDTPIYYEVRGQGKPIIMVYGIACLINHWRHQIRYFSENYQTIVFDLRGHHHSAVPHKRENLSIDAIAQDIILLAEHLKIKKASFWGHSFGAQLLLPAYDLKPELFHNLVMVNGFATNPLNGMLGTDAINQVFQFAKQSYDVLPETLSLIWKHTAASSLSQKFLSFAGGFNMELTPLKDVEIYAKGVASIELDVFLALFEHMSKYNGNGVLDRIKCPTLIISGKKDTVTPVEHQENLYNKIKGSELVSVPYGTHCTQLDMPEFVNLKIEKFLKDHKY